MNIGVGGLGTDGGGKRNRIKMQIEELWQRPLIAPISILLFSLSNGTSILFKAAMHTLREYISQPPLHLA